jgi:hypothetical protein
LHRLRPGRIWILHLPEIRLCFDNAVREAFGAVRLFNVLPDRSWHTVLKISSGTFLAAETAAQALKLIATELEQLSARDLESTE